MKEIIESLNLDANESAFFARQLEHIKSRTYDILYPEYSAMRMIPVSTEAGSGAESITYHQYDTVGLMKIIANYADDLPRSDVFGKEITTPVRSLGGSYGYSIQEIRASNMANKNLDSRKAAAVKRSYEQSINKIGWFARPGDAEWSGLTGMLYNPNVTVISAPTGTWSTASADNIIADVNKAIRDVRVTSKGVEFVDTVAMPIEQFALIGSTPRSSTSDTTILEFLRRVHPNITFEGIHELNGVNPKPSAPTVSASTDVLIAYRRSPEKLTLEIPQPFEQFAAQERNLEFVVPAHGRCGGVIIYYPLSVLIMEGI